jgi:hypothetical protein
MDLLESFCLGGTKSRIWGELNMECKEEEDIKDISRSNRFR